jgi:hypothetical protein
MQVDSFQQTKAMEVIASKTWKVGFEVLTAVSMKMAGFWVVAPCSLVEVYQRYRGPCCHHQQGDVTHGNVGKLLPDYTVLQPRRQPSSKLGKFKAETKK